MIRPAQRRVAVIALLASLVGVGTLARIDAFALPPGTAPSGTVHLNPQTGDSGTTFQLVFDQLDSYCDGDGVAGYRWHTFITSASNDPATLTFAGSGSPASGGVGYTQPLRTPGFNIIRQQPPTPQGSAGFINLSVDLSFASPAYGATLAGSPALGGEFWVGLACTADTSGNSVEYWAGKIATAPQDGAGPNNFTFAPAAPPATTTTASATSTTVAGTTTSVAGGATTTTALGGTSTTSTTTSTIVPGDSTSTTTSTTTTTTTVAGATTSTTRPPLATPVGGVTPTGGGVSSGGGSPGTQQLAQTGSSSWQLVVWAVLLLVFGRMAVLLARTPKVIDARR